MALHKSTEAPAEDCVQPDTGGCAAAVRLAFRIPEVCRITGLGRTSIYAAIKSGKLCARKWGRTTVVLATDLENFLESLPATTEHAWANGGNRHGST